MKRTAVSDKDPLFHVFKQQLSTILWQQRTIWENEHGLKRPQLHDISSGKKKKKKRASLRPTVKYFHSEFPRIVDRPFYRKYVFPNNPFWCSNKCETWRKTKEKYHPFQEFSWVCMKGKSVLGIIFLPFIFNFSLIASNFTLTPN